MVNDQSAFGKKVFFLNPPAVIGEVVSILSDAEFEVYTTRDHAKLARYLHRNPDCLVFVNIDAGSDEGSWRSWIKSIRADEATKAVRLGVVTMLDDDAKKAHYLMDLGVDCGFIVVKIGAAKTADILLKMLEANEARGRRKFVRVTCPPESADFNCRTDAGVARGWIRDLSSVGMAAVFSDGQGPRQGARLPDIQLSLRGSRVMLNGIIVGTQAAQDGAQVSVVMFEPASVSDDKRLKLRSFIHKTLQAGMDGILDTV